MSGRAHSSVLLMLLSLSLAPACKKELPERVRYSLELPEGSTVPKGAGLYAGEARLGTVEIQGSGSLATSEVVVMLERERTLADLGELSLRFASPCGLTEPAGVKVELSPSEDEQRAALLEGKKSWVEGTLIAPADRAWPIGTTVWTDFRGSLDPTIMIGQHRVHIGQPGYDTVWDFACASSHPVTIDGQEVDRVEPGAVEYLLSARKDACYFEQVQVCLRADQHGSAGAQRPLRGAHVYALEGAADIVFPTTVECSGGMPRVVDRVECSELDD